MKSRLPEPFVSSLWSRWRGGWGPSLIGLACSGLVACRGSDADAERAAPEPEPERFSFTLPSTFVPIELRGEGSETLRAPSGARVSRGAKGFNIDAGGDFALEVMLDAPSLDAFAPTGVARVLRETDLAIFKSARGDYSFVVVRELVPEWDDNARRRLACGSAGGVVGGAATGAAVRGFSKSAAQNMVAACRTLELPRLE